MDITIKHNKPYLKKPLYRYSKVKSSIAGVTRLNTNAQQGQSYLEFFGQKKYELDEDIVFFESQPFTLIYDYEGRKGCIYTPDDLYKKRDGTFWVIERKHSSKLTKEEITKHEHIAMCLWDSGIYFACLTEKDIGSWCAMNTMLMFTCYLKSPHSERELEGLLGQLPVFNTYGVMLSLAESLGYSTNSIMTLLARKKLFIDIDIPLQSKSLISKTPFSVQEVAA
jgi:hypothetical protein